MYRNLVTSLFEHERVKTTDAKAKGVRSLAEKIITLGKRGGLHARRRALRVIRRREVAAKVFDDLAERYRDRPGGYTRILKLGIRPGDAASMSIIELVDSGAAAGAAPTRKAGTRADRKADAKASKKARKESAADARSEKAPAKKGPAKKAAANKTPAKKESAKQDAAKPSKKKALAAKNITAKKKAVRKKKSS